MSADKMPVPISCEATLNGISTRADGTISFRLQSTREFNAEETTAVLQLNRMMLNMLLTPLKSEEAPFAIQGSDDKVSASERLRRRIFAWYKREQEANRVAKDASFDNFYAAKMQALIDFVDRKVNEP